MATRRILLPRRLVSGLTRNTRRIATQLDDQSVVGSTDLISTDFRHDLLCSISKLQRANRLLRMVHNWANSRNKRRTCVASETIL